MDSTEQNNASFASGELEQSISSPDVSQILPEDESFENEKSQKPLEKAKAKPKRSSKDPKKAKQRVIFNVSDTRYEVVRSVGRKFLGYKLTTEPEVEWDVFWTDNAVSTEVLAKMQQFQKINHFPGMYSLARKNHLGRHLMRMKKAFPKNYKFFPQTYLLPAEYNEFKSQFSKNKKPMTFIAKPEASCQGRGIFLTKNYDDIQPGEHFVVQRYLHKPFLLDGLKFDLRIYVLLAGCDPLRIYLFDDGLARFATEKYVAPSGNNLQNMCIHLTNYAINKDNPNFVFNESAKDMNVGHKRSLKAVMKTLEEKGYDVKTLWNDIKKIVVKTFSSVQPILAHSYKSCQPDEPYNHMCFEVLGFDIILDHKLKPWLLEVNHTPSFTTDTPLDKQIKRNVIKDALTLMNISVNNRIRFKNKRKAELQQRVLTGKKFRQTPEEKQAAFEKAQKERDIWEGNHLGGYEKIYPTDDPAKNENYEEFIQSSHQWWEEWTGTRVRKNVKKPPATAEVTKSNGFSLATGSTSNQSSRANQIQNIYSQKLKVGNQKAVKARKSEAMSGTAQSGSLKAEVSNSDKLENWNFQHESNPQNLIIGEDEKDFGGEVPQITEQESCCDVVKEDNDEELLMKGYGKSSNSSSYQRASAKKDKDQTRGSVYTEEAILNNTANEIMRNNLFKVKKSGGVNKTVVKDLVQSRDKENPRPSFNDKTVPNLANPYKFPTAFPSNGITRPLKPQERAESEDPSQERGAFYYKPPKSITRVVGETEETVASVSLVNQERKIKTAMGAENRKPSTAQGNNDWYPKKYPKRNMLTMQQPKNFIGNFVTPKLFEMNVKTAKNNAKDLSLGTVIQAGLISAYGRGFTKGSSIQRELSSPPTSFGHSREQRYFNSNSESKKEAFRNGAKE